MKSAVMAVTAGALALVIAGCSSSGSSSSNEKGSTSRTDSNFGRDVDNAILLFKTRDPSSSKFFDGCYGLAVFPNVGKGAVIVGAANGTGHVFDQGKLCGVSEMTQGTFGLQVGGQEYSELIFFKDKTALDRFRTGNFEFSGQASAVAVQAGASTNTDYSNGVAIFTMTKGGLMLEASVGGQRFTYYQL